MQLVVGLVGSAIVAFCAAFVLQKHISIVVEQLVLTT